MEQIKGSILNQIGGNVSDKEVVIIQDTTELNYEKFRSIYRTDDPDLGPTGNDNFIGFFLHCSLVIDAESSFPLGFSDIQIWNRHFDKVGKVERKYQFQRIEDKESNRWLTSVDNSARVSNSAALRWFVSDRESDIYDLLAKFPMERAHFVIRISQNRTIKDSESLLFDYIDQTTPAASYPIEIIEKKSAEKKTVNINVRFGTVEIKVPKSRQSKTEKKSIKLSFVEAYSKESQTPISWRLYTDVDVQTVDQALKVIDRYKQRWHIEVLFGLLKTKGFELEESQLSSGESLKKLCLLTLISALEVNQLRMAYKNKDLKIEAKIIFKPQDLILLNLLLKQYQGRTIKQSNPFIPNSLAWAAWIIGRMGGWKGLESQGPPGIISFTEGYKKFKTISQAAEILMQKDVYKA